MIYLVNITALPPGSTTPQVLRFCAGVPGFRTGPSDTPANAIWIPQLGVPYHISRTMFGGNDAGGSQVGDGTIELNNDGTLDLYDFQDWAFDGQPVEVFAGTDGQTYAQFQRVFKGVIQAVEHQWDTMVIHICDRQQQLNLPIPGLPKYLGTNSGSTGIEGLSTDIMGKFKPVALGNCKNVTPVLVNTSVNIYQVHYRQVQDIPAVYMAAVSITKGADYANETLLAAATIAGGTYATCLAKGLFRINAALGQQVTADVLGDAVGGYVNNCADILGRLLTLQGWSAGTDYDATSLATLKASNSAEMGIYDTNGASVLSLMDQACAGPWAWFCPNRQGVTIFGRVQAPSGSPVATFTDSLMMDLARISNDITNINVNSGSNATTGNPWSLVTLNYGQNYTVMSGAQIAGAVATTQVNWLAQQFRQATSTTSGQPDATVLARHPLAEQVTATTPFVAQSDATAEAQRRAAFRSATRRAFQFKVDPAQANSVDIGSTVALTSARFGLAASLFTVTALNEQTDQQYVEVTVNG